MRYQKKINKKEGKWKGYTVMVTRNEANCDVGKLVIMKAY